MKLTQRLCGALLAIVIAGVPAMTAVSAGAESTGTQSPAPVTVGYADHPQFRGSTEMPGVTDAKTPLTKDSIEEKWQSKRGSGWMANAGTPIAVGDYVYIFDNLQKQVVKLNAKTGEELAKSTECPGSTRFFANGCVGDGKIFIPLTATVEGKSAAIICAYDLNTLKMLWRSAPIGNLDDANQPLSGILYHDGYIYTGVSNGPASKGAFVCLDTEDTDPTKTDEVKEAVWTYQPETGAQGYYWSMGAIVGDAIAFGGEAGELVLHSLTTDEVYDRLSIGSSLLGIRSAVHYDAELGRLFATTKGGYVCSVKIGADNTFDASSLLTKKLGNDITSSPVSFKGRLYVGGGGIESTAGFSVLNAENLDFIYGVNVQSQSSPILTTAYATEENNWRVYIYVTQYNSPSSLMLISDEQGQEEESITTLIAPSKPQYCTQSATIDKNGWIYYINDTGYLFAFGHKNETDGAYTAADVDNSIKLLASAGKVELEDEFAVNRVQARYDELSEAERAKVKNAADLKAMQDRIALLKDETAQAAEISAALAAIVLDEVTLEDDAALNALLARYNALSADGQALVTGVDTLKAALAKIQGLKDTAMAASITAKIAALPAADAVCLDDKTAVLEVRDLLAGQNDAVKAAVDAAKLNALVEKVEQIEKAVKDLSDRIFKEIRPMNVTLGDKDTVRELIAAYEAIGEKDRKHVTGYDDVLYAQKVIEGLEAGKVEADVFANLFGSDESYSVEGKAGGAAYTVTFKGTDITDPTIAFDTGLSFNSPNKEAIRRLAPDAVVLRFSHHGALPGPATVEVAVELKDGAYTLYYYNEATGKAEKAGGATVKNGKAVFTIRHCSDYFLSAAADVAEEQAPVDDGEPAIPQTGVPGAALPIVLLAAVSLGAAVLLRKKRCVK